MSKTSPTSWKLVLELSRLDHTTECDIDQILGDNLGKDPFLYTMYLEGYQSSEKNFVEMKMKSRSTYNFRRCFVQSLINSLVTHQVKRLFCSKLDVMLWASQNGSNELREVESTTKFTTFPYIHIHLVALLIFHKAVSAYLMTSTLFAGS